MERESSARYSAYKMKKKIIWNRIYEKLEISQGEDRDAGTGSAQMLTDKKEGKQEDTEDVTPKEETKRT